MPRPGSSASRGACGAFGSQSHGSSGASRSNQGAGARPASRGDSRGGLPVPAPVGQSVGYPYMNAANRPASRGTRPGSRDPRNGGVGASAGALEPAPQQHGGEAARISVWGDEMSSLFHKTED